MEKYYKMTGDVLQRRGSIFIPGIVSTNPGGRTKDVASYYS